MRDYAQLFHVTEEATAKKILAEGYAGGWGDVGYGVYFYNNLDDAVEYARRGGWDGQLARPAVIESSVPYDRFQKVEPHPEWPNPEDYETVRYAPMDEDNETDRLLVPSAIVWHTKPSRRSSKKRRTSKKSKKTNPRPRRLGP